MTNIETVQELYRSSRSKDYDAFRAICTDHLEWVQMPGFPGGATWHGPQAVIEGVFHIYDLRDGRVCRFRQFTDTKVICDALP